MSALRSLRPLDNLAASVMHNEMCRGYTRKVRKVRKKPAPPEAWQQRRREYLEETGKVEKHA